MLYQLSYLASEKLFPSPTMSISNTSPAPETRPCANCHAQMPALQYTLSTGATHVDLRRGRYGAETAVGLHAYVCPNCGHVDFRGNLDRVHAAVQKAAAEVPDKPLTGRQEFLMVAKAILVMLGMLALIIGGAELLRPYVFPEDAESSSSSHHTNVRKLNLVGKRPIILP